MCGVDILEYFGYLLGVQSSISCDGVGQQGVWPAALISPLSGRFGNGRCTLHNVYVHNVHFV